MNEFTGRGGETEVLNELIQHMQGLGLERATLRGRL